MFEIPIPSEICNLVNFVALDVVTLSLIMVLSGKLAGHANHASLLQHKKVRLTNFDVPLIGGGLVMQRGWRRDALIALRVSVVVCVAACNFGLEGRSRIVTETREMLVRRPGNVAYPRISAARALTASEAARRCGSPDGNSTIVFGAVLDGQCYVKRTEFVYVRRMGVDQFGTEMRNVSATNCTPESRCDMGSTLLKCSEMHIVCHGVEESARCGTRTVPVNQRSCCAVTHNRRDEVYVCYLAYLHENYSNLTAYCRYVQVRWEHVSGWSNYLYYVTTEPLRAVFAAAYAVEVREYVGMPIGQKTYTVVRLSWILPTSWVMSVALGLAVWWIVDVKRGAGVAVHDERGLVRLIGHQLEAKYAISETDESVL